MPEAHPPEYGTPQLPDSQPPVLLPLPIDALNEDNKRLLSCEWHSGQTTSSVFSDDLCRTSYFVLQLLH